MFNGYLRVKKPTHFIYVNSYYGSLNKVDVSKITYFVSRITPILSRNKFFFYKLKIQTATVVRNQFEDKLKEKDESNEIHSIIITNEKQVHDWLYKKLITF